MAKVTNLVVARKGETRLTGVIKWKERGVFKVVSSLSDTEMDK